MSMSLVLSSLREESTSTKNIVLWSRIDQKSCFKAIQSAGLQCVIVPTKISKDEVVTDMDAMELSMRQHEGRVLAVITTTSCFAPRVPDHVDEVAKLCQRENVAHVINNAYGLQCETTSKLINRASVVGRVDAVVCSTDKNFLVPVGECSCLWVLRCALHVANKHVPSCCCFLTMQYCSFVGGAVVISPSEKVVQNVGKVYAGRASSSPVLDLFITLLSMGLSGYKRLLSERNQALKDFSTRLHNVAKKYGERLLHCPSNTISFGITLDNLARRINNDETEADYVNSVSTEISYFGSMLFNRCVSGTRVVPRGQEKSIGGSTFVGFGSSTVAYLHAYMTAACAIGVSKGELDEFFIRLDKTLKEFKSKHAR